MEMDPEENETQQDPQDENIAPSQDASKDERDKAGTAVAPLAMKRERKPVQRLEIADKRTKAKSKIDAGTGKGVKLGEIPNIGYRLSKLTGADDVCKIIHNLLYRRTAKKAMIKRNIMEFSGFVYTDAEKEREKDKIKLSQQHKPVIHALLEVLDLERGTGEQGTKEVQVDRILSFLECPTHDHSKKDIASAEKKKKEKAKASAERKRKRIDKKRKKKTTLTKKMKTTVKQNEDVDEEDVEEEEDEDDEPLILKVGIPNDQKIEAAVKKILSDADLNTLSMKGVRDQLGSMFNCDLTSKKKFISVVVTRTIEEMNS